MQEHNRPWERLIRELHRGFDVLDREIRLLRGIDQAILSISGNGRLSMEELFLDSLKKFTALHRIASPAFCYVYLGDEPGEQLVHLRDGSQLSAPARLEISPAVQALLQPPSPADIEPVIISDENGDHLFVDFVGAKTILLCPIYLAAHRLLCLLILTDAHPPEGSHLGDLDFKQSLASLASQLSIAYDHHDRERRHRHVQSMWTKFLELNLSPTVCFKYLALQVPNFLPTFGPIQILAPTPQVQVLMLMADEDGKPDHLVIRGTTGHEYGGTRVAIERSICGLLVEDLELPFFCDDPTKPEYEGRYRDYLGQGRSIKTELAVRIRKDGNFIGILNLESEVADAFNIHHRHAIMDLAEMIAPVVAVFEQRITMNTLMQYSVMSSTRQYLEALAGTFGHAVGTPLKSMHTNIGLASKIASNAPKAIDAIEPAAKSGNQKKLSTTLNDASGAIKKVASAHVRLLKDYKQIKKYTDDFISDIASYAEAGSMNLVEVVGSAVALAADSLLSAETDIRFDFAPEDDWRKARAFCSNWLKQHLYSIFNNAVLSVQERMQTTPGQGIITITIEEYEPPQTQEVSLNRSWAVRIHDNGMGVDPEQLEALRRFEPGVRFRKSTSGHGYGLTAAQRYVTSVGGRVDLNSELGKFFEVILYFVTSARTAPSAVSSG